VLDIEQVREKKYVGHYFAGRVRWVVGEVENGHGMPKEKLVELNPVKNWSCFD
jgi:hypothetical protein